MKISSTFQNVDIFTKSLIYTQHNFLANRLGLLEPLLKHDDNILSLRVGFEK